jgi:hypothetical protein
MADDVGREARNARGFLSDLGFGRQGPSQDVQRTAIRTLLEARDEIDRWIADVKALNAK